MMCQLCNYYSLNRNLSEQQTGFQLKKRQNVQSKMELSTISLIYSRLVLIQKAMSPSGMIFMLLKSFL